MPDLIPFVTRQLGSETVQTVNARDLHTFLGVKTRFHDWITRRIESYGFVQDIDFTCYSDLSSGLTVPSIEYYISLNMAKELSMVERTKKGKEARLYFLACEKALQEGAAVPQVKNPAHQMLIEAIVRLDAVEQRAIEAESRASAAQLEAARATAKADYAIERQPAFTVAEYVYVNKLQGKIPESAYKDCSAHLRHYCFDHNIPFRKVGVGGKRWEEEYSFLASVYTDLLPGWLARRYAQSTLRVVPTTNEENA